MKKIMFDNHYGLEDAVLNGTKTMTRRIIKGRFEDVKAYHANGGWHFIADTEDGDSIELKPHYETCEIAAIAQSYHTLNKSGFVAPEWLEHTCESSAGYKNKMFVRADLMPHVIEITDIKAERLQDISDEDCRKEGITKWLDCYIVTGIMEHHGQNNVCFDTPREAFAALIDRISGRGTWQRNEWQFAYTFKLIK